jgi:hypothetical protein
MKILSALLLFTVACAAIAQPESRNLRRDMERFYERWDMAVGSGSVGMLTSLIEPDFYQTDKQGRRVNASQFADQMREMMSWDRNPAATTTVLHVREGQNEAFAWVRTVYSQNGRRVQTLRMAHSLRRTPDGWRIFYSQILPDNETWGPPPGK